MADGDTNTNPTFNGGGGGGPAGKQEASTSASFPPPGTARRLLRLLGGSLPSANSSSCGNNNSNAASQLSQPAVMAAGSAGGSGQAQPLTEQEGGDLFAYLQKYGRALHADDCGRRRRLIRRRREQQQQDAGVQREEEGGIHNNAASDDEDGNDGNNGGENANEDGSNNRDDALFAALVVATLRAAHRSTADPFRSSAVGATNSSESGTSTNHDRPTSSGSSSSGSIDAGGGGMGMAMMEIDTPLAVANMMASGGPPPFTPRLARRLLTDGLLPLAGVGGGMGGGGGNGCGGMGGNGNNNEEEEEQEEDNDDVVGELVRRCVVECILPCAVVVTSDPNATSAGAGMGVGVGNNNVNMDGRNCNSDIGIDVLLPSYLNRLVGTGHRRAPAILDALCAVPRSGYRLRPHRAAAVAAALGELSDLCPTALTGCVGPVAVSVQEEGEEGDDASATGKPKKTKKESSKKNNKDSNSNKQKDGGGKNNSSNKSKENDNIDRITSLTDALLRSLRTLTTVHTQELDCLPPLVYQLCLLPSKIERGSRAAAGDGTGRSSFLAMPSKAATSGGSSGGGGASTAMVVAVSDVITVELRIRILAGIADVFDGLREKVDVAARAAAEALASADSAATAAAAAAGQQRRALGIDADAVRWAVGTSLSHVGTGLRGDPDLVKAVLRLVKGDIPASVHDIDYSSAPFRYLRLTPFRLCLGLTAASALPRTRATALEAVRDLIVEEQTIATKRSQSPWFNAVAGASVLLAEKDPNNERVSAEFRDGSTLGSLEGRAKRSDKAGRHVFSCIQSVVGFASSKDGIGAELTGLMQSLVNLGFLLVDCVKKDSPTVTCVAPTFGVASSVMKKLSREGKCPLDELRNTGSNVSSKANEAAADVGRRILAFLFVTAGSKAHSDTMSSLSSNAEVSPLCRSILHTASGKFCGMAPNAVQHSFLLRDLALGTFESLGDVASSAITALATDTAPDILSANFIPTIINYLSNIPGGGMPPAVAIASVVPALNAVLHHQCCRRRYRDVEDNVDHCFLLGKKAIFCTDPERRAVAVNILCMLIGIVVVSGNTRSFSLGSGGATLDEIRGYLRRCLTQHQPSVRMEVYSSLVELLPCGEDANGEDSTTPSASLEGDTTPVPIVRRGKARVGTAICDVVADILSSQLERYVTPAEDKADKKARRDRAKKHGSQLSQPMSSDEDEDENESDDEKDDGSTSDPPIRFELCLQDGKQAAVEQPPTKNVAKGKKVDGKSKKAQGPTLIEIARNKIAEPIPFLLASCSEVVVVQAEMSNFDAVAADEDRVSPNDELSKAFASLRKRVAKSKLDDYLAAVQKKQAENDDTSAEAKKERTAGLLATCLLVASAAETLMGSDVKDDTSGRDPGEITERLFRLRTDAVDKAATILATPSAKEKKAPAEKGKPTKKKKKKMKAGEENDHPNLTIDDDVAAPKEIKKTTLDKARKAVEDQISQICPASDYQFLAHCLRTYGVSAEDATSRSQLTFGEDQNPQTRLTANIQFRTFILNKSLHLFERSGVVIKAGRRFDPASIAWKHEADDNVLALKTGFIASSMMLGSLAFSEFASHCSKINRTSIAQVDKGTNDIPLTELSLAVVVRAMQRMTDDHPNHQMSKERRAFTLLMTMFNRTAADIPSTKKTFQFYAKGKVAPSNQRSISAESLELRNHLLALASPVREYEDNEGRKMKRGGLLAELLSHSMENEARECVRLIACAGSACSDPSVRMSIGASILSCWEKNDGAWISPLGLDHRDSIDIERPTFVSPTVAVEASVLLGGHLDGDTRMPLLPSKGSDSDIIKSRATSLFPIMASDDWPKHHRKGIEQHLDIDDCAVGVVKKLSIAMLVRLQISASFNDELDAPSRKPCKLSIIDTIAAIEPLKGLTRPRELGFVASSVQSAIDIALTDADYVCFKVLPHLNDPMVTDRAMEYVAGRLLAVACTVSNVSGIAEDCDDNAAFMASLLKSTKRVYSTFTKLIQLQMKSDLTKLASPLQSLLLEELSTTMTPRTMCLLLAATEHVEVGERADDGKQAKTLTEKQLNAQGKVASEVVFNKERLDSFLSKASKQLKKAGLEDESEWLEGHITRSDTRSFRIRTKEIAAAQEREAPRKKDKKRKAKTEGGTKKKPKKKIHASEDKDGEDDQSMADTASVMDASIVGDDDEVMDDSTMGEEEQDDDDDDDEDDDDE